MSDRPGLSIFDDDNGNDDRDDATQVIPVAKVVEATESPTRRTDTEPAPATSVAPPQPPEPPEQPEQPARVIPATAAPARQSTAGRASSPVAPGSAFPVVRRGGYDKDAVDRRLLQFAGEKDGLSLADAAQRTHPGSRTDPLTGV